MKSIAVTEFKAHCLSLLEDVARTGETIELTKRGKPIARVIPSTSSESAFPQDTLAGTVTVLGDILEPVLPLTAWDAARGEIVRRAAPRTKRSR